MMLTCHVHVDAHVRLGVNALSPLVPPRCGVVPGALALFLSVIYCLPSCCATVVDWPSSIQCLLRSTILTQFSA